MGEVYKFHTAVEGDTLNHSITPLSRTDVVIERDNPITGEYLNFDNLYPMRDFSKPELAVALGLLDQILNRVDAAIKAVNAEDFIEADDQMQRIGPLLPELFCCRTLGDGFGMIVNAVWSSFENQAGKPLSLQQILAIGKCLRTIHAEPMLSDSSAIERLTDLDSIGLNTDIQGFDALTDWLDG